MGPEGTEERTMWKESFDMGVIVALCKTFVGHMGLDHSDPRAVAQIDYSMRSSIAAFVRRKCHITWDKFRAGELVAQKRHPNLMQYCSFAKQAPTGAAEKQAPSGAADDVV